MNKPITIIGIILILLGAIGMFYMVEFVIALIIGFTMTVIGIAVDVGKFSKTDGTTTEFCSNCGSNIKKGAKFCPYCKKKL